MAAVMFRNAVADASLRDIRITSAGLHAIPGNQAHPRALAASVELGLPLTDHRAQVLTPELMSEADVIFAMDFQNMAELLALYPEFRSKVAILSDYAEGEQRGREIPDPYFGDLETTRQCYGVLQTCIRNLAADLLNRVRQSTSAVRP
jgi:protein-tyrosine-phosphatase